MGAFVGELRGPGWRQPGRQIARARQNSTTADLGNVRVERIQVVVVAAMRRARSLSPESAAVMPLLSPVATDRRRDPAAAIRQVCEIVLRAHAGSVAVFVAPLVSRS